MKLYLTGPRAGGLRSRLKKAGFILSDSVETADLIFVCGGDGAMLTAAADYPDRLIFAMRDEETAPLCPRHSVEMQLSMLLAGEAKRTDLPRLAGEANGKTLYGINDIFIHNKINVAAMRYDVMIDSELYGREIVGDGVGVSTVHGSTAYYRSITHSVFRTGIGLAFSNSTELVNHLVLPECSRVRIRILRGPCEMVADNSRKSIPLAEGDEALIHLSGETTPILGLDIFMCPECRMMRHDLRRTVIRKKSGRCGL